MVRPQSPAIQTVGMISATMTCWQPCQVCLAPQPHSFLLVEDLALGPCDGLLCGSTPFADAMLCGDTESRWRHPVPPASLVLAPLAGQRSYVALLGPLPLLLEEWPGGFVPLHRSVIPMRIRSVISALVQFPLLRRLSLPWCRPVVVCFRSTDPWVRFPCLLCGAPRMEAVLSECVVRSR